LVIKPIFKNELELLLEVSEALGWLLAGFLGFGFDCVVEVGMVLIIFTGAGSGFGASHIHKGIPHLQSITGAAL